MSEEKTCYIVLGSQWGDEGKGKIVDKLIYDLLKEHKDLLCVRFNGGANAGHTIRIGDKMVYTHLIPSGIVNGVRCLLGNGTVINLNAFFKEINELTELGIDFTNKLFISNRAHMTTLIHCLADAIINVKIGTTKQGIGMTYADKANRWGITINDLLRDDFKDKLTSMYERYMLYVDKYFETNIFESGGQTFKSIEEMFDRDVHLINMFREKYSHSVCNGSYLIDDHRKKGGLLILEGANATMLDIECGTYPYVTSCSCSIGGVLTGISFNADILRNSELIGVLKAYVTRVGGGVLPTELTDETGDIIQRLGGEFGVTTKRKRRCGWLDLVQMKYSVLVNGYTHLNLTKADILSAFDSVNVCVAYKDKDGNEIKEYPSDEKDLQNVFPVYKQMAGWKNFDFTVCNSWSDLHPNFREYVLFIQNYLGVLIKYINTGQERDSMIIL